MNREFKQESKSDFHRSGMKLWSAEACIGCFYIRLGTLSLTTCDVSLFPPVLSKLSIDEGGEGDACGKSISQLRKSDVPVNQATMDGFIGFLIFAKRCKLPAH